MNGRPDFDRLRSQQRLQLGAYLLEHRLKALMEEIGLAITKTYLQRGLLVVSVFAVETRYPGRSASKHQAVSAVRWMVRVRELAQSLLGIRSRRRK